MKPCSEDDAAETGYWAVRTALSRHVADATAHIAHKEVADKNAQAIIRLVQKIAPRFSAVVTEQAAAKAAAILGAMSGGAINYLFIAHYQDMASGDFAVKRLEKKHGPELVRKTYEGLAIRWSAANREK